MIKKILFLFLLSTCYFLLATSAFAKDFSSFYKVTYEFGENGDAIVSQEISLVNLVADLYVSQYSLSIVGGQISKIEAFDKIGPLKTKIDQKGESTIITLSFNEQVVGKDKLLSFILKYRISGLAKKEGNLWQISIPKLVNSKDIEEFELVLKTPTEFGKPSIINPDPLEEKILDGFLQAKFKKEQIVSYGVIATFGQSQIFDFEIIYNLYNKESSSVIQKIAIPPDTNYQTIYYELIDPYPQSVELDEDGNWLASFQLAPKSNLKVNLEGKVNIFSQPKVQTPQTSPDKSYLSASKYWEVQDEKIKQLADKLKTPENIYKFVVNNLTYDYRNIKDMRDGLERDGLEKDGLERKGALFALAFPQEAACTQFSDLFVAVCRAAGIPAREVQGYAYTDNRRLQQASINNDLLHSWPEYFDEKQKQWIMVDPTWGNTTGGLDFFNKFDMSHFAFVFHGKSDSFPLPPGSYKDEASKDKQIFVNLSREENFPDHKPKLSFDSLSSTFLFSGRTKLVEAIVTNTSGMALHNLQLSASPDLIANLNIQPQSWLIDKILPYSNFKIKFSIQPKEELKDYFQTLTFNANDNQLSIKIEIKSLFLRMFILFGVVLSFFILFLVIGIKKRSCRRGEKNGNLNSSP